MSLLWRSVEWTCGHPACVLRTGMPLHMPWPGLASQFFASCFFMGSSGCAWKSSRLMLGSSVWLHLVGCRIGVLQDMWDWVGENTGDP